LFVFRNGWSAAIENVSVTSISLNCFFAPLGLYFLFEITTHGTLPFAKPEASCGLHS
jgi:hypothetical protein